MMAAMRRARAGAEGGGGTRCKQTAREKAGIEEVNIERGARKQEASTGEGLNRSHPLSRSQPGHICSSPVGCTCIPEVERQPPQRGSHEEVVFVLIENLLKDLSGKYLPGGI